MNRMEQRVGLRWSIGYHVSMTWEVVCFFPLGPTRSMMILLDTFFRIGLRDLNPSACGLTTTGVIRGWAILSRFRWLATQVAFLVRSCWALWSCWPYSNDQHKCKAGILCDILDRSIYDLLVTSILCMDKNRLDNLTTPCMQYRVYTYNYIWYNPDLSFEFQTHLNVISSTIAYDTCTSMYRYMYITSNI